MKQSAKDWLLFADKDLALVKDVMDDEYVSSLAAFHCQQAVEKSLKAVLENELGEVVFTHTLVKLYKQIPGAIKKLLGIDTNILSLLDSIYTEARYPNSKGVLPDGEPTIQDVAKLFEYAQAIHKKVNSALDGET